jgi:hypothetical protein
MAAAPDSAAEQASFIIGFTPLPRLSINFTPTFLLAQTSEEIQIIFRLPTSDQVRGDSVEGARKVRAERGDGGDDQTAIRPAMRPYSMAVAPDWSAAKRVKRSFIRNTPRSRLSAVPVQRLLACSGTSRKVQVTSCDRFNEK